MRKYLFFILSFQSFVLFGQVDSSAYIPVDIDEAKFKLQNFQNFYKSANNIIGNETNIIRFPDRFAKLDFLKDSGGSNDITRLIGNIVIINTNNVSSYGEKTFTDLSKNYKLKSVQLKVEPSIRPEVFKKNFDNSQSGQLNFLIGNINTGKDYAYNLTITELSSIGVNTESLDLVSLKRDYATKTNLNDYYIVVGVTTFYITAQEYKKANLNSGFEYAIGINGKSFKNTSIVSNDYKIAVQTVPLKELF
ncbi:hypothetical protein [Empedobacter brevis]|uniref:hypothetical protein n=1 Tax=Empedobacter brevis TaxID=247 RepID=UPI0028A67592|nr:hypothetical protein [Empedobacter brevis]